MNDTELQAGRELDAKIAVEIMGWRHVDNISPYGGDNSWYGKQPPLYAMHSVIPYYSTDIAAAWEVAMTFISAGCAAWIEGDGHTGYGAGCTSQYGRFEVACEESPALAMCKAALKAAAARTSK